MLYEKDMGKIYYEEIKKIFYVLFIVVLFVFSVISCSINREKVMQYELQVVKICPENNMNVGRDNGQLVCKNI